MTSFSCNSTNRGLFSISGDMKAPIHSARSKKTFHTFRRYIVYTTEFVNDIPGFITDLKALGIHSIESGMNNSILYIHIYPWDSTEKCVNIRQIISCAFIIVAYTCASVRICNREWKDWKQKIFLQRVSLWKKKTYVY